MNKLNIILKIDELLEISNKLKIIHLYNTLLEIKTFLLEEWNNSELYYEQLKQNQEDVDSGRISS